MLTVASGFLAGLASLLSVEQIVAPEESRDGVCERDGFARIAGRFTDGGGADSVASRRSGQATAFTEF